MATAQLAGTSNYRTLDELQARLDPDVFWRVHRSHLVNINKIKEIVPWFSRNYILRMKDAKGDGNPGQPVADQAAAGVPEAVDPGQSAPLVPRQEPMLADGRHRATDDAARVQGLAPLGHCARRTGGLGQDARRRPRSTPR